MSAMERVDEGEWILRVNWIQYSISGLVLILRVFTQLKLQKGLELDDSLMLFAFACGITHMGLITEGIRWGIGRHAYTLTEIELIRATKYEFLSQPWSILCPTFGRISFIFFISKFIGSSRPKRLLLWSLIVSQVVVNLVALVQLLIQCENIAMLWDTRIERQCMSLKVQTYFGSVQGAFNSLSDIILTLVPLSIILKLRIKRGSKVSLAIIMSLSVFAMVASIIKTIELQSLATKGDFTFETSLFILWCTIENNVVIILASIPKIRPLYIAWRKGLPGQHMTDSAPSSSAAPCHPESRSTQNLLATKVQVSDEDMSPNGCNEKSIHGGKDCEMMGEGRDEE